MRSEEMQEKRRKQIDAINVRICKNCENEGKSCMYLYVFSAIAAGATLFIHHCVSLTTFFLNKLTKLRKFRLRGHPN